jgi:hypothetical protein
VPVVIAVARQPRRLLYVPRLGQMHISVTYLFEGGITVNLVGCVGCKQQGHIFIRMRLRIGQWLNCALIMNEVCHK